MEGCIYRYNGAVNNSLFLPSFPSGTPDTYFENPAGAGFTIFMELWSMPNCLQTILQSSAILTNSPRRASLRQTPIPHYQEIIGGFTVHFCSPVSVATVSPQKPAEARGCHWSTGSSTYLGNRLFQDTAGLAVGPGPLKKPR